MRIKGLVTAAALAGTAPLVLGGAAAPAVASSAQTTTAVTSCRGSVVQLDPVTYAERLVRAWGRGDRATAACYGAASTVRALFAQASPGGIHWRRISEEGAAGTIYVGERTWKKHRTGAIVLMAILNGVSAAVGAHNARHW